MKTNNPQTRLEETMDPFGRLIHEALASTPVPPSTITPEWLQEQYRTILRDQANEYQPRIQWIVEDILNLVPKITPHRLTQSIFRQLFGSEQSPAGIRRTVALVAARVVRDTRVSGLVAASGNQLPPTKLEATTMVDLGDTQSRTPSQSDKSETDTVPTSPVALSRLFDQHDREVADCYALNQFGGWTPEEISQILELPLDQVLDALADAQDQVASLAMVASDAGIGIR